MDISLARKLSTYQPDPSTSELIKQTPVLLLVGPTGAGKDTLKDKLLSTGNYHHIISHTTRPPRLNHGVLEKNGVEYHFINKNDAERMLDEKAFIEAKIYSGNLYGTSVSEIRQAHDEGKIAMTDIEVQGVAEYKTLDPGVMAVFLLPPGFEIWQKRLQNRYGEVVDITDYRQRLQTALEEIEQLLNTNYYTAIINDDLDSTFDQVQKLAHAKDHPAPDDSKARALARQLALDIQAHLTQTEAG